MARITRMVTKACTAFSLVMAYPLFLLSCLIPRSQRVWVFVGWHRGHDTEIFADNTKYLFLHIANTEGKIRPVWLAKDEALARTLRSQGYHACYEKSIRGIWYALRAGTTVIDAFLQPENFRWTGRTRLVQLLHGKGMKKGGYAERPRRVQDVIFTTSPFVSTMLPPIFVEKSSVVVAGYPRTDVLFAPISGSEISVSDSARAALNDRAYQTRILYAPTFRRGEHEPPFERVLELERLSAWLTQNHALLVINLHPKYRHLVRGLAYPHILFLEESDIYPLLPRIDILITDYSSIFSDFLLLDQPIIFYPYDLGSYREKEGLSFDNYDEYTPGPKTYTPAELLETLEATLAHDAYVTHRRRMRDLYHTYQDGKACERIMSMLAPQSPSDRNVPGIAYSK